MTDKNKNKNKINEQGNNERKEVREKKEQRN
jgi:hypothetical protein